MQSIEYDELPKDIRQIVDTFDDSVEGYQECNRIISELNKVGWTADYYLDGVLFDFRKTESELIIKI